MIYELLQMPVERIDGVGLKISRKLIAGGVESVGDLLLHLPKQWLDDREIIPIRQLVVGEESRIGGMVVRRSSRSGGRSTQVNLVLQDDDGEQISLCFFHAPFMMRDGRLAEGQRLAVRGKAELWHGQWQMAHPDWVPEARFISGWLPIYAALAGINGLRLRGMIEQALKFIPAALASPLDPIAAKACDCTLAQALHRVHGREADIHARGAARQRLCVEELLCYLTLLDRQRKGARCAGAVCANRTNLDAVKLDLPFQLTPAQHQAVAVIGDDLASGARMHRLLQGDVGSGKTVVAALAAAQVMGSGYQVAVMAPTETLAEQLHRTLTTLLAPLGCTPDLITGSTGKRQRKQIVEALSEGDQSLVIGTHALLSPDVQFAKLGLAVVDEQHRFGVRQRWGLTAKGEAAKDNSTNVESVHLLAMSATPIPRSLALALYGDMELTVMQGMPIGRKPVDTRLITAESMEKLLAGVVRLLAQGARVYWIVPFVEDEELSVDARVEFLRARLPTVEIVGLHGQMKSKAKQEILARFSCGEAPLLVSTTVVEVGVDVPEARLMVIEQADQYGLAQLHQLRGRVGRSSEQGYCMLLPGASLTSKGEARLRQICQSHDGMVLAEFDMQQRGSGDAIGSRQSGDPGFRLLDMAADGALIRHWHDHLPVVEVNEDMVRFWRE
ncbi:MAG: ATP-dependent DNA helicase RecG [Mariprofundales bacterium]|nr:ATP-dependent DNA helicase RecG [Mariprofundales bacterium]